MQYIDKYQIRPILCLRAIQYIAIIRIVQIYIQRYKKYVY